MIKKITILASLLLAALPTVAQDVQLPEPNKSAGLPVMEAFAQRRSVRNFSDRQISPQQLSNLLWAAMGQNRPDGRLTAPSCLNFQEIHLYIFDKNGVAEYIPATHSLKHLVDGDHRALVAGGQDFVLSAPVSLVMVAEMTKFGNKNDRSMMMASVDAGIVSENISIACAGLGLSTVPRATMAADDIVALLGLDDNFIPIMNNPVGFQSAD